MTVNVQPGDLMLTRSKGWVGKLVRLGALLGGQLESWDHVAVMHHTDDAGTPWAVEGRPGGVGWVDARKYIHDPHTISNVGQPKTGTQRRQVCDGAVNMLGVAYNWQAIGLDAVSAARIRFAWQQNGGDGAPAHVVCSSLCDWLYEQAGLTNPAKLPWALTVPADWAELIFANGWQGAGGG